VLDDQVHDPSVRAVHLHDGHIRRVSRDGLGDRRPVAPEKHHAAQPVRVRADDVVDLGALEQSPRHPDDVREGRQRRCGSMRFGRLGVVDVVDALHGRDLGDPVVVRTEADEPVPHGHGWHAVGARQSSGRQRVRNSVRCERGGVALQVAERAELGGVGAPVRHERTVGQHVVHHAQLPDGRHPQREPDRPRAVDHVGLTDHLLGGRVLHVVDARDLGALVDAGLVGGVAGEAPLALVPVDVVGSEVEARAGQRAHGSGPVQLEAGELDGVDVDGLGGADRLDDRPTHVADGGHVLPSRGEDRREHLHGRGLAVGASQRQPGGTARLRLQLPGELDLRPDRHPGASRRREQRLARRHARRRDDEVHARRQCHVGALAQSDVGAQHAKQRGPLLLSLVVPAGDHDDVDVVLQQGVRRGETGDTEPEHADASCRQAAHEPTTHSA
jgi:hypothetical protein